MRTVLLLLLLVPPFSLLRPSFCGDAPFPAPSADEIRAEVRLLGAEDHESRQKAARALMEWGSRFPDAVLAELPAEDPDPEIQSAVARLRKAVPWASRYRTAREIAGSDEPLRQAVDGLFRRPSQNGLREVVAAAGGRKEEAARIVGWFLDFEDPPRQQPMAGRGVLVLDEEADGSTRTVSCAALDLLKSLDRVLTAEQLAPLVAAADDTLRRQAGEHLLRLPAKASLPLASGLLSSADAPTRGFGLELIQRIGDPASASQVERMLKDGDPAIRVAAAQALSALIRERALDGLLPLLQDKDANVQRSVLHLVASLEGKGAIPRLGAMLDDPDPLLRDAASAHLERLAGVRFVPEEGKTRVEAAAAWWSGHKDDPEYKRERR